jgi:addiction module RelE/StbE family toxin
MSFRIFLTRRAEKDLDKMDSDNEERVRKKIKQLEDFPEHFGKPLKGDNDLWVLKIGRSSWRAIYKMDENEDEITIIAVGHRRNVYQEFP